MSEKIIVETSESLQSPQYGVVEKIKHNLLTQLDLNIERGEKFSSQYVDKDTSDKTISNVTNSLQQDGYNVEVVDMGDKIRISIYTD